MDFTKAQGNKLLDSAKKKTQAVMNSAKIVELEVDKIDPNPDNDKIFNMNGLDGLADSIRNDGFTGAIEVFEKEDGRYEILSGHRRYEANKMAGNKTIPAIILPRVDEAAKARRLLSSNIYNREMTPVDKARAVEYYITNVLEVEGFKGAIINACAEHFHVTTSQIKRYRMIARLIPSLQRMIENGVFPYTALDNARTLKESEQEELYNRICDELKTSENAVLGSKRIEQFISAIKIREEKLEEIKTREVKPIQLSQLEEDITTESFITPAASELKEEPEKESVVAKEEHQSLPQKETKLTKGYDVLAKALSFGDEVQIGPEENTVYADEFVSKAVAILKDAYSLPVSNKDEMKYLLSHMEKYISELKQKL